MKLILFTLLMLFAVLAAEAQPIISQQPTNQVVINGGTAVFNVSVSGNGPFSYQWQFNGANFPTYISTFAGNGTNGYSGDGGPATSAKLNGPSGVVVDSASNLFIEDELNSCIRKVGTNGIISTVAGHATNGYSGDGGAATNAMLNNPASVAVDSMGNLFIADSYNGRIRKVGTNGIITTVAGNGTNGYAGDGGAATNAMLSYPLGVAKDSAGNLFIADRLNQRIRKVDTNGIITTVAGNGTVGYNQDPGDGGAATNGILYYPSGVAVDKIGNFFIADHYNQRIRKVGTNGIITTVAGNGTNGYAGDGGAATNAMLSFPFSLAVDNSGNLFIADVSNNRIRKVGTNGIITTVAGNGTNGYVGDSGVATSVSFSNPSGVAVDSVDNLFIADQGNQRIWRVDFPPLLPTLTLRNVSTNNIGNYSVVISNPSGSVTSSVATLAIVPFIAQQPQNQLVQISSNVSFSVTASGLTPLRYQWFFSNPNLQTPAGAIAQLFNGFVYGAVITNGGSGYTTVPQVQFSGGGGSGAAGFAVVSNGMVTAITVTNTGSGYTSLPVVQIDPPNGLLVGQTNATLNLTAITTNNVGNYFVVVANTYGSVTSSIASLTIAYPPGISQQPQSLNVAQGSNAAFNVNASGTTNLVYQWWMVSGTQSNATAVPVVINGFVLAANMTSGGAGYLAVPNVQIVGGSGSGAGGYAVVSNRMVSAVSITNPGSGYTTPPTIQIAAPSAISLFGQTNATLTLLAVTNGNAANYFMVVTNNFGSVTSAVAALTVFLPPQSFLARSSTNHQIALQLTGSPNYPYILQSATNLTPPVNWKAVLTNPADGNGNWQFTETNLNGNQKFYRAVGQ